MLVQVTMLCLILCDPMDCRPQRLLHPLDFPGMYTGVGLPFHPQGIFLNQALNLVSFIFTALARWILYH